MIDGEITYDTNVLQN